MRSADCIASGNVQVVVINKKEFLDLDKRSPLLAWMLDFDAVTAVLKVLCHMASLAGFFLSPSTFDKPFPAWGMHLHTSM